MSMDFIRNGSEVMWRGEKYVVVTEILYDVREKRSYTYINDFAFRGTYPAWLSDLTLVS